MKKHVAVLAPHPDDETLGCGGTLLRHRANGDACHWILVSEMTAAAGFSSARMAAREKEIQQVAAAYEFQGVHRLGFPTASLETLPLGDLISRLGSLLADIQPHTIYIPAPEDVHSDHRVVFSAASSCLKWFRRPGIQRILAYETLSETDFSLGRSATAFAPNVFAEITNWLNKKIDIMRLYSGELQPHPFPRSETSIRSLAALRGAQSGCQAAEAFMLLKEIWGQTGQPGDTTQE